MDQIKDLNSSRGLKDNREYRIVELLNGLEVLLISSSNANVNPNLSQKSAAAACVQVGSFADPDDLEGCAHFVEHMVFMGSERYPKENCYDSFIQSGGGTCNASTDGQYTCFQFDIKSDQFKKGFDIFAQCFISPLLSINSMDREINAIDSEFKLAKSDDESRMQQLCCHTAISNHLIHKFSWGNRKSLYGEICSSSVPSKKKKKTNDLRKIKINQTLKDFHRIYYRPSNTKLVVYGPFDLDTLHEMVAGSFSEWKNEGYSSNKVLSNQSSIDGTTHQTLTKRAKRNVKVISLPNDKSIVSSLQTTSKIFENVLQEFVNVPTYAANMHQSVIRMIPIEQERSLIIEWQLPSMIHKYKSKPCGYLSHLIGHEASGSILVKLKESGYASALYAGVDEGDGYSVSTMFTMFSIRITLTQQGLINWVLVVRYVYAYLAMLKESFESVPTEASSSPSRSSVESIFNELRAMSQISYDFMDQETPVDYAERLSIEMLPMFDRNREDLLPASVRYWDWEPTVIGELLDCYLIPSNARILLMIPDLESGDDTYSASDEEDEEGSEDNEDYADDDDEEDDEDEAEEEEDDDARENAVDRQDRKAKETELFCSLYEGPVEFADWCQQTLLEDETVEDVEPHFQSKYWKFDIPLDVLNHLWHVQKGIQQDKVWKCLDLLSIDAFHLPHPNSYIPRLDETTSNDPITSLKENEIQPIHHQISNGFTLWYLPYDAFKAPKVDIRLRLSSMQPMKTPLNAAAHDLLVRIWVDVLTEAFYFASLADLEGTIEVCDEGVDIQVNGFQQNAGLLIQRIMQQLFSMGMSASAISQADSERNWLSFSREKDVLSQHYHNLELKAKKAATQCRLMALKQFSFTNRLKLESCEKLTLEDVQTYCIEFSKDFSFEMLIVGCISETSAVTMTQSLLDDYENYLAKCQDLGDSRRDKLNSQPVHSNLTVRLFKPNETVIIWTTPRFVNEKNVCVEMYYQCGPFTLTDSIELELLEEVIKEHFFDVLRTKQQIGYYVDCSIRETCGVLGFCFVVVSSKYSVTFINKKIEEFVKEIPTFVLDLSSNQYKESINVLIHSKLSPVINLKQLANRFWSEIDNKRYQFDIIYKEVDILESKLSMDADLFFKFVSSFLIQHSKLMVIYSSRKEIDTNNSNKILNVGNSNTQFFYSLESFVNN